SRDPLLHPSKPLATFSQPHAPGKPGREQAISPRLPLQKGSFICATNADRHPHIVVFVWSHPAPGPASLQRMAASVAITDPAEPASVPPQLPPLSRHVVSELLRHDVFCQSACGQWASLISTEPIGIL